MNIFRQKNKKYYTIEEIKKHNTINSLWIVRKNKVYDVTKFAKIHPGGIECILNKSNPSYDCEKDYKFHSENAKKLWDSFLIGYTIKN